MALERLERQCRQLGHLRGIVIADELAQKKLESREDLFKLLARDATHRNETKFSSHARAGCYMLGSHSYAVARVHTMLCIRLKFARKSVG